MFGLGRERCEQQAILNVDKVGKKLQDKKKENDGKG